MKKAKDFLNYVLQDDTNEFGYVSFNGQTLKDFLAEIGLNKNIDMEHINITLKECGIKPIII